MNEPGQGYPLDQDTSPLFDHAQCVPARWSHRTHNHEGATGAWLFPSEQTQADAVRALVMITEEYARERFYKLPGGIRLEMHPSVHNILRQHAAADFPAHDEALFSFADIPVKIDPDLPKNGWRLVIVTTETINAGVMPS